MATGSLAVLLFAKAHCPGTHSPWLPLQSCHFQPSPGFASSSSEWAPLSLISISMVACSVQGSRWLPCLPLPLHTAARIVSIKHCFPLFKNPWWLAILLIRKRKFPTEPSLLDQTHTPGLHSPQQLSFCVLAPSQALPALTHLHASFLPLLFILK